CAAGGARMAARDRAARGSGERQDDLGARNAARPRLRRPRAVAHLYAARAVRVRRRLGRAPRSVSAARRRGARELGATRLARRAETVDRRGMARAGPRARRALRRNAYACDLALRRAPPDGNGRDSSRSRRIDVASFSRRSTLLT